MVIGCCYLLTIWGLDSIFYCIGIIFYRFLFYWCILINLLYILCIIYMIMNIEYIYLMNIEY